MVAGTATSVATTWSL